MVMHNLSLYAMLAVPISFLQHFMRSDAWTNQPGDSHRQVVIAVMFYNLLTEALSFLILTLI